MAAPAPAPAPASSAHSGKKGQKPGYVRPVLEDVLDMKVIQDLRRKKARPDKAIESIKPFSWTDVGIAHGADSDEYCRKLNAVKTLDVGTIEEFVRGFIPKNSPSMSATNIKIQDLPENLSATEPLNDQLGKHIDSRPKALVTLGEGDCFLHALFLLTSDSYRHFLDDKDKLKVVKDYREKLFANVFPNDYARKAEVSKPGEWIHDCDIHVIAKAYQVNILIYTETTAVSYWSLDYENNPTYLLYNRELNHFEAVIPDDKKSDTNLLPINDTKISENVKEYVKKLFENSKLADVVPEPSATIATVSSTPVPISDSPLSPTVQKLLDLKINAFHFLGITMVRRGNDLKMQPSIPSWDEWSKSFSDQYITFTKYPNKNELVLPNDAPVLDCINVYPILNKVRPADIKLLFDATAKDLNTLWPTSPTNVLSKCIVRTTEPQFSFSQQIVVDNSYNIYHLLGLPIDKGMPDSSLFLSKWREVASKIYPEPPSNLKKENLVQLMHRALELLQNHKDGYHVLYKMTKKYGSSLNPSKPLHELSDLKSEVIVGDWTPKQVIIDTIKKDKYVNPLHFLGFDRKPTLEQWKIAVRNLLFGSLQPLSLNNKSRSLSDRAGITDCTDYAKLLLAVQEDDDLDDLIEDLFNRKEDPDKKMWPKEPVSREQITKMCTDGYQTFKDRLDSTKAYFRQLRDDTVNASSSIASASGQAAYALGTTVASTASATGQAALSSLASAGTTSGQAIAITFNSAVARAKKLFTFKAKTVRIHPFRFLGFKDSETDKLEYQKVADKIVEMERQLQTLIDNKKAEYLAPFTDASGVVKQCDGILNEIKGILLISSTIVDEQTEHLIKIKEEYKNDKENYNWWPKSPLTIEALKKECMYIPPPRNPPPPAIPATTTVEPATTVPDPVTPSPIVPDPVAPATTASVPDPIATAVPNPVSPATMQGRKTRRRGR